MNAVRSFSGVMRSEWTKLVSLRGTWFMVLISFAITLGISAAIGANLGGDPDPARRAFALADPTSAFLLSLSLSALVIGVLGALSVSSEYATSTMSATLIATPQRVKVFTAKILTLISFTAPVAFALSLGAWLMGNFLVDASATLSLSDEGIWQAILGGAGYLVSIALLGAGLAFVVRSTAISITLLVALIFVLPPLLPLIPYDWVETASKYFPGNAGSALTTVLPIPGELSNSTAVLTLILWVGGLLLAGFVLFFRKDA